MTLRLLLDGGRDATRSITHICSGPGKLQSVTRGIRQARLVRTLCGGDHLSDRKRGYASDRFPGQIEVCLVLNLFDILWDTEFKLPVREVHR